MECDTEATQVIEAKSRLLRALLSGPVLLLLALITGFLMFEAGARLVLRHKDEIRKHLLGYVVNRSDNWIPDPKNAGNWVLRPGYSITLKQYYEAQERQGHLLSVKHIEDRAGQLCIGENDVVFQINRLGFKGPEVDTSHSRLRILTLGDSVTYGSFYDRYSYPRVLEKELRLMGVSAEVINAGVPGYTARNILLRLSEFEALKPEIATVFIGWNSLFDETEIGEGVEKYLYSVRLLEKAREKVLGLLNGYQQLAISQYNKPKRVDPNAVILSEMGNYSPGALQGVEKIVIGMRSIGSRVVLVTLPGLFVMDEPPSDLALKIGHLPTFTDNPYVLAKMTERYNAGLRDLGARQGLSVVDLAAWSKGAFRPRDKYFSDSVHLTEEGQVLVGRKLAEELLPMIGPGATTKKPTLDRQESVIACQS